MSSNDMDEVAAKLWGGEKYVLGPMVRACSLPLRLACLDFGADAVYSEEIPAYRAITCRRYVNRVLNTIDFVRGKGNDKEVLFRTHAAREKDEHRCVLQLGTADAFSALNAAKVFEGDVAAIDVNMGCPKHYSISKGMGSELMCRPEVAEDIVKTLRRNCSVPISVKTRLFATSSSSGKDGGIDINQSIEWVRRLQSAGAQAVCVHFRTPTEKNNIPAHGSLYSLMRDTLKGTGTHFIYNGDVWTWEDIDRIKNCSGFRNDSTVAADDNDATTSSSSSNSSNRRGCFMLSRAALWDPSVFSTLRHSSSSSSSSSTTEVQPVVPLLTLLSKIVTLSAQTANCPLNTRYLLQQMMAGRRQLYCSIRQRLLSAFTLQGLSGPDIADCESEVTAERQRQETEQCRLNEELSVPPPLSAEDRKGAKLRLKALKLSQVSNCPSWPGIVSLTSHQYNDSYFDDNYYVSFRRATAATTERTEEVDSDRAERVDDKHSRCAGGEVKESKKRSFAYAQFTTTTTTTSSTTNRNKLQ